MTTVPHAPLRCPVCDSSLSRDTIRPPCSRGCTHPNGAPRLAEVAGPRSGRPVCGGCARREQHGGWPAKERDEWLAAELKDRRRPFGGGW
jgi:hypothetical protein